MKVYRIFIVEDDRVIAEEMKRHIEKWGFEVAIDSDLENVMGDFTKFKPDLVLLDVNLPFYNGFFRCSKIREVSRVPVIFVSFSHHQQKRVFVPPHDPSHLNRRHLQRLRDLFIGQPLEEVQPQDPPVFPALRPHDVFVDQPV